jgi:hypothetical protein
MRKIEFYLMLSNVLNKMTNVLLNLNTACVRRARKELTNQCKVS